MKYQFFLTETYMDKVKDTALLLKIPTSQVIPMAINLLYLKAKVPGYTIAFIDKHGKIVNPVNLEDINDIPQTV